MRLEQYDYLSGNLIGPLNLLNFGNISQGQHCLSPLVFRLVATDQDSPVNDLRFYLISKGSWQNAEFGYFTSNTFIPGIESGSQYLSNHLVVQPDATSGSPHGIPINWDGMRSDYIWLDVQLPVGQTGIGEIKFRLILN